MELAYKLETEDVWLLYRYSVLHIPGIRNRALTSILLYPALVLAAGVRQGYSPVVILALTALFGGLSAFFWYRSYRARVMAQAVTKPGLVGDHMVRFTDEGLWDRTSDQEALTPWPSIARVVEYQGFLFLFDAQNRALIIPREAFAGGTQEAKRTGAEALRLMAGARSRG